MSETHKEQALAVRLFRGMHRTIYQAKLRELAEARAIPHGLKFKKPDCCAREEKRFMAAWMDCPGQLKCLSQVAGACCACLCGDDDA